jgi:hypothetical protein
MIDQEKETDYELGGGSLTRQFAMRTVVRRERGWTAKDGDGTKMAVTHDETCKRWYIYA